MHGVYLSVKNGAEGFRLPINPEKVDVSVGGNGEEFTIAKLGTINIPKDIALAEYSLESYFPLHPTHLSTTTHMQPGYYIEKLRRWQRDKIPVRYIYANGSFTINEAVTIESFEYNETDSSGDVYFKLSLKKYVFFAPRKMVVKKATSKTTAVKKTTPPRQNPKPKYKTYSLKKGDSLWKVAQKYTGKGSNYPALAKLNNIKPSQYRKLPIGLKLKIPPSWTK